MLFTHECAVNITISHIFIYNYNIEQSTLNYILVDYLSCVARVFYFCLNHQHYKTDLFSAMTKNLCRSHTHFWRICLRAIL